MSVPGKLWLLVGAKVLGSNPGGAMAVGEGRA